MFPVVVLIEISRWSGRYQSLGRITIFPQSDQDPSEFEEQVSISLHRPNFILGSLPSPLIPNHLGKQGHILLSYKESPRIEGNKGHQ